jgi:hypothetical protein
MYFRGPVLTQFDGREWTALAPGRAERNRPPTCAPAALRCATSHARAQQPPLAADARRRAEPPEAPGFEVMGYARPAMACEPPHFRPVRYRAEAIRSSRAARAANGRAASLSRTAAGLQPAHGRARRGNAREPALANADTQAFVRAALQRLRTGGYTYTLEPGVYGNDTADEFWFDRKEGFCEHIASAFVVLMRAWAFRRASSPATRAANSTASTTTGCCARAMRTPGPRSGRKAGLDARRPDRRGAPGRIGQPAAGAAAAGCSPAPSAR